MKINKSLLFFCTFLAVCFTSSVYAQGASTAIYYNIAHSVNNSKYIDWAISQGANAIEADLNFTEQGAPFDWEHRISCEGDGGGIFSPFANFSRDNFLVRDNSFIWTYMKNVDPVYNPDPSQNTLVRIKSEGDTCRVRETVASYLHTLATKSTIALFIVDSKVARVQNINDTTRRIAGANVVSALNADLFDRGYRGKVIIGVSKSADVQYLASAIEAAKTSPYASRIYFSFDEDGQGTVGAARLIGLGQSGAQAAIKTITLLSSLTTQSAYANGITSLLPSNYETELSTGVSSERAGIIKFNYIWTLESPRAMESYLNIGARGLMVNNPILLSRVLNWFFATHGGRLAKPDDPL
jgi:hypothetical protein